MEGSARPPTHTRRFAHRLPTRSSAVLLSPRWYFNWLIPWWTGLPKVAPLWTGFLRFPRRTRIR